MVNEDNKCCKKECGPSKTHNSECVHCINLERKVCEAEKTVSARDVLIEMLQKEIKKMENICKKSIDDYEKLRFNHCTSVQQLSNLREIHKKLKNDYAKLTMERNIIKSRLSELENETEKYKDQFKISETQLNSTQTVSCADKPTSNLYKDTIKELINIESNIENENRRLKDLMCILLDGVHNDNSVEIERVIDNNISKNNENNNSTELVDTVSQLSKQIKSLNDFALSLKSENDTIKYQLIEKISNLSSCLSDMEKSHSNITNLSVTVGSIVSERDNYLQQIKTLKRIIDENTTHLKKRDEEISELKRKCDDMSKEVEELRDEKIRFKNQFDQCMVHAEQLQQEYSEREKSWEDCKCKLMDNINEEEQNNKYLNEKLVKLTNENKSNLEEIAALNQKLAKTCGKTEECNMLAEKNLELIEKMEEYKKAQQQREYEADLRTSKTNEEINQLNFKIMSLEKDLSVSGIYRTNEEYDILAEKNLKLIKEIEEYKKAQQEREYEADLRTSKTNEEINQLICKIESLEADLNLTGTCRTSEECDMLAQKNLELIEEIEEYKKAQQQREYEADLRTSKTNEEIDKLNSKIKSFEKDLSVTGTYRTREEYDVLAQENLKLIKEIEEYKKAQQQREYEADLRTSKTNEEINQLICKIKSLEADLNLTGTCRISEECDMLAQKNLELIEEIEEYKKTQQQKEYETDHRTSKTSEEINQLNCKIKSLEKETEEYKKAQTQREHEADLRTSKTNEDINQLICKIKSLEADLNLTGTCRISEKCDMLAQKNLELIKEIEEYKKAQQQREHETDFRTSKTNEDINQLICKIKSLEADLNLTGTCRTSEECDMLTQKNLELREEIEEYKKAQQQREYEAGLRTAKTNEEINQLNCKIKSLENEIEEYKKAQQQREYEADLRTSKSNEEINELNCKVKSLEKNLNELTLENNEYEEDNKYYLQQLEELLSQMHVLEYQKLKADEDNEKCYKIIDELKRDYEKLDSEKDNELKQLKEEINEAKKNQEYLYNSEKRNFENKIILMEAELKKVKCLQLHTENENNQLINQINTLHIDLQDSEKNNEDSKNKIALMEEEVRELKYLIAKMEDENDKMISEINILQTDYQTENTIAFMEEELKKVNSLKAKLENENNILKSQINNLKRELADIHESTENQILDLQRKFNELEKQQIDDSKRISTCGDKLHHIKQTTDEQKFENEKYSFMLQELEKQKALLEEEQLILDKETRQNLEEIELLKNRIQECKEKVIKNEDEMKEVMSINEMLHEEIETMGSEYCREERLINHLEQCIERSSNMLEECEKELKQMHIQNEILKQENDDLKTKLKNCCEAADNSQENNLQDKTDEVLKQQLHPEPLEKSKDETTNTAGEIDKILRENKEKDEELDDLRKQLEFIRKSSEIYKYEYEKLKKAYTELKSALTQRMKEYSIATQTLNKENVEIQISFETETKCRRNSENQIKELEATIREYEMRIKNLQHQLTQSANEICQLKGFMNKLISDNKTLKQAIETLLNTLVEKFKAFSDSGEDIEETSSARIMMQDVLDSLVYFEKHITRNNNCTSEGCNCMSVISSLYKPDNDNICAQNTKTRKLPCKKAVPALKRNDKVDIESSEILGICTDCCSTAALIECDSLSSIEHEGKDSFELLELEQKPEVTDEEPIIITPDDST